MKPTYFKISKEIKTVREEQIAYRNQAVGVSAGIGIIVIIIGLVMNFV